MCISSSQSWRACNRPATVRERVVLELGELILGGRMEQGGREGWREGRGRERGREGGRERGKERRGRERGRKGEEVR